MARTGTSLVLCPFRADSDPGTSCATAVCGSGDFLLAVKMVSRRGKRAFAGRPGIVGIPQLLEPDPARRSRAGTRGMVSSGQPRLFVFSTCRELIEQLQSAPIETQGEQAGKAVAGEWESGRGHSVAMLRYGVLSRPVPSALPDPEPADPRVAWLRDYDRRQLERGEVLWNV